MFFNRYLSIYYYFMDILGHELDPITSNQMDVEGINFDENTTHFIVIVGATVCVLFAH